MRPRCSGVAVIGFSIATLTHATKRGPIFTYSYYEQARVLAITAARTLCFHFLIVSA